MTSLTASKTIPPTWKRTPVQLKATSPTLARTTPRTMTQTLSTRRRVGFSTPQSQATKRTATGAAALSIWVKATER